MKETDQLLAIEQGFHGRTDRPAQISHSCKEGYDKIWRHSEIETI